VHTAVSIGQGRRDGVSLVVFLFHFCPYFKFACKGTKKRAKYKRKTIFSLAFPSEMTSYHFGGKMMSSTS